MLIKQKNCLYASNIPLRHKKGLDKEGQTK